MSEHEIQEMLKVSNSNVNSTVLVTISIIFLKILCVKLLYS